MTGQTFVSTITHEPLYSAWWNFARTCKLTTGKPCWISRSSVKGQGHMFFLFFFPRAWCCGYPRTVLSFEQGVTILFFFIFLLLLLFSPFLICSILGGVCAVRALLVGHCVGCQWQRFSFSNEWRGATFERSDVASRRIWQKSKN